MSRLDQLCPHHVSFCKSDGDHVRRRLRHSANAGLTSNGVNTDTLQAAWLCGQEDYYSQDLSTCVERLSV